MKYAVLFGGNSYEHEISIVSAITLREKLESLIFIFLNEKSEFFLIESKELKAEFFSSKNYLKKSKELFLKKGGFYYKGLLKEKKVDFDVIINLVHGIDGEDGKIASLLEFYDIDFIGPRIEASVIAFNKFFTKLYAKEMGINVVDYKVVSFDKREHPFDYPVIVKPLRGGSSIGVEIAKEKDEFDFILDKALEFDEEAIVEPFIAGVKEYNIAGCLAEEFIFSFIEEPQKKDFLDFEKKYLDFSRSTPIDFSNSNISQNIENEIKRCFVKIYEPLFRGALIRCDFFVIDDKVFLNEINTTPGSLSNYLFKDFSSVLEKISKNLPKKKEVSLSYEYVKRIRSYK